MNIKLNDSLVLLQDLRQFDTLKRKIKCCMVYFEYVLADSCDRGTNRSVVYLPDTSVASTSYRSRGGCSGQLGSFGFFEQSTCTFTG